jgi:zinc/manganese transport system ATP-binding protein
MAAALTLDNVTLGYDRHPAVHHLTGEVEAGSLLAVVGPNGAGKSTLLKGLIGAIKPLGGRIVSPDIEARRVAYVPQQDGIDLSYPVSVFDLVAMGLWERRGLFGGLGRADAKAVAEALALVGLSGFEKRPVGTLSGGQLQRALFARVTLQNASLILLDEPFSAIDNATVDDLMQIVRSWAAEHRTVIAVLHDLALVRAHFPQTLLLARQAIGWGATATVLTPENVARARGMTEAFDDSAPLCETSPGVAHNHAHDHHQQHAHGARGHHHDHAHAHEHQSRPGHGSSHGA